MSAGIHQTANYQWKEKRPEFKDGAYSHQRAIYFSSPDLAERWVAKIETALLRNARVSFSLPHAEEIAYKVCKMFGWNTVPKTKVVHASSMQNEKYTALIQSLGFLKRAGTFTFQIFKEGNTLPDKKPSNVAKPDLSSFVKAFLLGMILGKSDARGDNTLFNPQTKELFEIDNEFIGREEYQRVGVLNQFETLKKKKIPQEILTPIVNATFEKLIAIRNKYQARDNDLLNRWAEEEIPTRLTNKIDLEGCWEHILSNFEFLQSSINTLTKKKKTITISRLEKSIKKQQQK